MADLSDIQDALAAIVAGVLYPDGTGQPSAITAPVRIYCGWPQSAQLDADLRSGKVNVTVYNLLNERSSFKYLPEWREVSRPDPTLALTISGDGTQLTITGAISSPQNVSATIDGVTYTHPVQPSDTLATIAAGLATLISADTPATSNAGVVTLDEEVFNKAAIGVTGTLMRELRRQEKQFMISIWAPSHALRVAASKACDLAFASRYRISLADSAAAFLTHVRSTDNDNPQEALLYRRDIVFSVEYPTVETTEGVEVLASRAAVEPERDDFNVLEAGIVPPMPPLD